jgi:hypothetical protein
VLSARNNYINEPAGGVGQYFISCRNCQAPFDTYMVTDSDVIHLKGAPDDAENN